jgi:hypothetical protein
MGYRFGLEIPEPGSSGGLDPQQLRPKRIETWMQELPLADAGEAARQIFTLLARANLSPLSAATRFNLLEQIRGAAHYAVEGLEKSILARSLPLTPKGLRLADQAAALLGELAVGYKIIVVDLLAQKHRVDRKLLAQALHRGVDELARGLTSAYRLYTPHPRRLWQEIHQLYHHSEQQELAGIPIKDHDTARGGIVKTVETAYKQVLLLALADPYRLRHGEVQKVYDLLTDMAEQAELYAGRIQANRQGHLFVCRLGSDLPPRHWDPSKPYDPDTDRLIDLAPMCRRLRERLQDNDSAGPLTLSRPLWIRLLRSWEGKCKRTFSRTQSITAIQLAVGLHATHHVVGGDEHEPPSEKVKPGPPSKPALDPLIATHTEFSLSPINERLSAEPPMPTVRTPEYAPHNCRVVDMSAGGYCLLWDEATPLPAQVGELVALREDNEGPGWYVGAIRWMQYLPDQGLKMGIQVLAPAAIPVTAHGHTAPRGNGIDHSCLELPGVKAADQPPSLLTPPLAYQPGDTVTLDEGGRRVEVQLTRLLENTGNFARFQYSALGLDPLAEDPDGPNGSIGPVPIL